MKKYFVMKPEVEETNKALNVLYKQLQGLEDSVDKLSTSGEGVGWAETAYTTTTQSAETTSGNNEVAVTIQGFTKDDFYSGKTVKILVPQLNTGSPTLNINELGAKPIKAVRDGQLVDITAHNGFWSGATRSSDNTQRTSRVWDNNTTLELIYDGTNWVVVGNPILCSYYSVDCSYLVYANGLLQQWGQNDHGSDARSINATVIFPIQFTDENSYMLNICGIRGSVNAFTGGTGARERHSYSVYCNWYGLSANDLSRYIKWEVLGY